MKKMYVMLFYIFSLLMASCSKDDGGEGNTSASHLSGTIHWQFAGKVGKYTLSNGNYNKSVFLIGSSSTKKGFDVSWDGKKYMIASETWDSDVQRFVLRDMGEKMAKVDDDRNLFNVTIEWDKIGDTQPIIAPNEQYFALEPQRWAKMPIVIVNAKGRIVREWTDPKEALDYHEKPVWDAQNVLYFRIGNSVWKCAPDGEYADAQQIISNIKGGSYLAVSPDGSKFVFRKDYFLWMCNSDGSDMRQITTYDISRKKNYKGDARPAFSPDGKHIVFTTTGTTGAGWTDADLDINVTGSRFGYLCIIPADGKLRNLDEKNNGAIYLKNPEGVAGIPCDGHLVWRP
ncbi:TolB family protein [Capnocytophaga cynodegmi]|uniref:TolB family protein n=1 Tax=Capnocytophaga cynodegmi TaxID=28189 RepID=UPI00385B079C